MAGPACKVIINNLTRAVSESLEEILKSPLVRGGIMISDRRANAYLQRLVDLDLGLYSVESRPSAEEATIAQTSDSLQKVVADLVADGVFTTEVWEILKPPTPAV